MKKVNNMRKLSLLLLLGSECLSTCAAVDKALIDSVKSSLEQLERFTSFLQSQDELGLHEELCLELKNTIAVAEDSQPFASEEYRLYLLQQSKRLSDGWHEKLEKEYGYRLASPPAAIDHKWSNNYKLLTFLGCASVIFGAGYLYNKKNKESGEQEPSS